MTMSPTELRPDSVDRGGISQNRIWQWALIGLAALFTVSIVVDITGETGLSSSGQYGAALRLAMPILLAGLGGLFSERAGIVNIGLEGMMIAGTWFGAWAGWQFNPWAGVVVGMLGGAIFGLIHAVATVTFAVDHIVSGVAINILALGGMRFLSQIAYDDVPGAGITQSPRTDPIGFFSIPILAGGNVLGWESPDALGWLEDQGWLLISEIAAMLRGLTSNVSWLTLIALLLVPLTWWLLWRTAWGLRLRSCGENPYAAESLGVNVLRMKYYGVMISGALAGLGGAYLVLVQAGIYREAQVAGRGFIGLAALIFGNWMPGGVLSGSLLFGFSDAIQIRGQPSTVHALLLFVAIALLAFAAWSLYRKQRTRAMAAAAAGIGFLAWYLFTDSVPPEFVPMTPYVVTLLVLATATQRLRMPAADGLRYRKGEAD